MLNCRFRDLSEQIKWRAIETDNPELASDATSALSHTHTHIHHIHKKRGGEDLGNHTWWCPLASTHMNSCASSSAGDL